MHDCILASFGMPDFLGRRMRASSVTQPRWDVRLLIGDVEPRGRSRWHCLFTIDYGELSVGPVPLSDDPATAVSRTLPVEPSVEHRTVDCSADVAPERCRLPSSILHRRHAAARHNTLPSTNSAFCWQHRPVHYTRRVRLEDHSFPSLEQFAACLEENKMILSKRFKID